MLQSKWRVEMKITLADSVTLENVGVDTVQVSGEGTVNITELVNTLLFLGNEQIKTESIKDYIYGKKKPIKVTGEKKS
jgi:hypothetical protein